MWLHDMNLPILVLLRDISSFQIAWENIQQRFMWDFPLKIEPWSLIVVSEVKGAFYYSRGTKLSFQHPVSDGCIFITKRTELTELAGLLDWLAFNGLNIKKNVCMHTRAAKKPVTAQSTILDSHAVQSSPKTLENY